MKEKKQISEMTYEAALAELQLIARQLQEEAIGMDELGNKVRRAAELQNICQKKLRNTELELEKIEI